MNCSMSDPLTVSSRGAPRSGVYHYADWQDIAATRMRRFRTRTIRDESGDAVSRPLACRLREPPPVRSEGAVLEDPEA